MTPNPYGAGWGSKVAQRASERTGGYNEYAPIVETSLRGGQPGLTARL